MRVGAATDAVGNSTGLADQVLVHVEVVEFVVVAGQTESRTAGFRSRGVAGSHIGCSVDMQQHLRSAKVGTKVAGAVHAEETVRQVASAHSISEDGIWAALGATSSRVGTVLAVEWTGQAQSL